MEADGSVETRVVEYCADRNVHWQTAGAAPLCTDPEHRHHRFDVHRHRTSVVLPDGTPVLAVSFDPADPYTRDRPMDFGLYLDDRWQPPWPHENLDWPDFGTPADADGLGHSLQALLDRARGGMTVEIGCLGGHGRTGTALSCMSVMCGAQPIDAVAWVRTNYCSQAVETDDQQAFVEQFAPPIG